MAVDADGDILVADTGNRRVQIFTARGSVTSIVPIASAAGEKPADPVDCAVDDTRQRLYVVDNDNHHLLVYSLTDLKLVERWGSEGDGTRAFRYSYGNLPPITSGLAVKFTPFSGSPRPIRAGDMVMRDANGVSCSILYGQDNRSPVTPGTGGVLYVTYAPAGVGAHAVAAQMDKIEANVRLFAPLASVAQRRLLGT